MAEYETASLAVIELSVVTSNDNISIGSFAPGTGCTLKVTFVTGLKILSMDRVPTGRLGLSLSSDGTYPLPIPIRNSISSLPFELT